MLKKLLIALVLLMQIGLIFAQNSPKPPPSPFSFEGSLNSSNLPNVAPPLPQSPLPHNTVLQANNAQSWNNSGNNSNNPQVPNANSQGWGSPPILTQEQQWQQMVEQNNQEWQQFTAMATGEEAKQDPSILDSISDKVYKKFTDKFKDIAIKLKPHVLHIFYALAIFNVLWLFFTHKVQGASFKEFMANFLINLFYFFLWEGIIMNFPSIAGYIPQFFTKIGIAVSSVPISETDILDYGINYIKAVWNNLRVGQPAVAIMYIILSVPTFFMILRMVLTYVLVLIEGIIIGQLNIIYLAFAGFSSLDSYAKKPFMYLVSIGLKLMFLQIFFGAILSIIAEYSVMPITQDLVLVMLIATSLCYVLVNETLSIVNNFIMGNASSTQFGSMKTALKDTLLDTYKAIQSMNDAKNLMDKAKEMQQQQVMERMHDPEFAQRFAPKFNTDENSSSTSNNQNTNKNAFANNEEAINTKNSQNNISNTQENFSKNNSNDTNQNIKVGATAQNSFDSKDNTNSVNKLDKKENINSSESNKNNAFNQSNQANQQIPNNAINKFKDSVGTLGKATKALLDNDFNLKKANQHLDEKIQKGETQINKALMSATNANQERLWDKIYSGKAPSYSEEAKQYIQHGNDLKNKPSYAQKYSDYVEQRRQEYHEQIQNSILPNNEDINPKQQDNQIDKGKNEE